nr:MAG TPA: hypothetical protein [Caudoviricetes sp.]
MSLEWPPHPVNKITINNKQISIFFTKSAPSFLLYYTNSLQK